MVRGDSKSVAEGVNSLAFVLLVLCVVVAPFPYGAVLPGGKLQIELFAFVAVALAFGSHRVRLGSAAIPVAALIGVAAVGTVQLVPLDPRTLRAISPMSATIDAETDSILALSGQTPIPARISIAPVETESATLVALAYAALLASAVVLTNSRRRRRTIIAALFITAAGHVLVSAAIGGGTERLHGAFVNPNHFAGYLQIPLAFAFGFLWIEIQTGAERVRTIRDRAERLERRLLPFVWRLLLWGVIAAGIVLTRSRGGILAASLTTLTMIAAATAHRSRRRFAIAIAAAILIGVLFVAFTTGETAILRFLASDPREIRTDTRMLIWRTSTEAWHLFPTFGSGLGTFREAFRRVQPPDVTGLVEQAHNDFLQLLVTGGWVGAAFGVIAAGSIFILLFIAWLRQRHREEAAIILAGMGALLSLTLHGIVDFNMSIPAIPATLAILLGLSFASGNQIVDNVNNRD